MGLANICLPLQSFLEISENIVRVDDQVKVDQLNLSISWFVNYILLTAQNFAHEIKRGEKVKHS